jgi:hypothetical protein
VDYLTDFVAPVLDTSEIDGQYLPSLWPCRSPAMGRVATVRAPA